MNSELQILLAEDQENDVTLLRQAFIRAAVKCTMQSVPDGAEALAYLGGSGSYSDRSTFPFPQLVLLDVNLPRLDGFEVLQRLRSNESLRPLIVHLFTSSTRSSDIERAYRLGANSYVVKPGSMDGLVAFARALQDWHRFVREARRVPGDQGSLNR
ncbi:MAG: response regulator [Verrucomicrobiales bacterium]|nr:response regulator [Verrucomicrobiales bacterium]